MLAKCPWGATVAAFPPQCQFSIFFLVFLWFAGPALGFGDRQPTHADQGKTRTRRFGARKDTKDTDKRLFREGRLRDSCISRQLGRRNPHCPRARYPAARGCCYPSCHMGAGRPAPVDPVYTPMRAYWRNAKGGTTVTTSPAPTRQVFRFLAFFCSTGPSLGFSTNTKQGPQKGEPTRRNHRVGAKKDTMDTDERWILGSGEQGRYPLVYA